MRLRPLDSVRAVEADETRPDPGVVEHRDELPEDVVVAEHRDELPDDLDVAAAVGDYVFPDNSRRRIPGVAHLVLGGTAVVVALAADGSTLVNGGVLLGGVALLLFGGYHLQAGWHVAHDERDALVGATRAVGFPVGHASAQMAWRGLRSRPTWRILLYSNESPPEQRGLVLVDAVDGSVVAQFVEENPEDWSGD